MTVQTPQAAVYSVIRVADKLQIKLAREFSTTHRAISIIQADAERVKEKGADVRKIGKYYFAKTNNSPLVMLYHCNIKKGLHAATIEKLFKEAETEYNINN